MTRYGPEFYLTRHRDTAPSAEAVLSALLAVLPPIRSAVDVGCGVGTWLACLKGRGVAEVFGIDGPWMDPAHLIIPRESVLQVDLGRPLAVGRRFDLAVTLEVAEHLAPERARSFVADLCGLADFVLFAAAIPHQGGTGHVNEQWQDYWAGLFDAEGYAPVDAVRPRVWKDPAVRVWYRQNTLLYVKRSRLGELKGATAMGPIALVHPDMYTAKVGTLRGAWKTFIRKFRRGIRPHF
jgi:SAM-dependent methyltransferase